MLILIASGDSVIGAALAAYWTREGHTVVCTSNVGTKDAANYLDVRDTSNWKPPESLYDRVVFTIACTSPNSELDVFATNVVGAYRWLEWIAQYGCAPNAQIAVLSSQRGSISELNNIQSPWYRMSKAALNMGVSLLARKYGTLRWLLVHPGLVDTPMTRNLVYSHAKQTPETCAESVALLLDSNPAFGFYDAVTSRVVNW